MKRFYILVILITSLAQAQESNIFLDRKFWKTNPDIETVKQKIQEGNNPTELNRFAFDAVSYALIENVNDDTIKYLLTIDGNGVNKITHDGRTYIFWAAYKDKLHLMKYLLSKGAKTDIIDSHGYSLLNFAATTGQQNPKLYDFIIENGANVLTEKNRNGANPLLLVLPSCKDFKMVDYFTAKGLDIASVDDDGNGAFNYVAGTGNKEMLQMLINKGLPYKNLNDKGGNAMLKATRGSRKGYNSLEFFKYLENLGIEPKITNNEGLTPLHNLSYRNKDAATIQYFIDKGVDVNQANSEGNTALMNAAYRNSLEIIKLLASQTKNINLKNKDGNSVLTNAIRNTPEVIDFVLKSGADVMVKDIKGHNLTYYLLETYSDKNKDKFEKKLNLLEQNGFNFAKPQDNGNTLYHLAIDKKSETLLELLKPYKIDINTRNKVGLTPLQIAVMTAKNENLIKWFIKNGAKTDVKTEFGETLYDLASENEALKGVDISFLK